MAEAPSRPTPPGTLKAPKDKSCPYCHQAFTSSSLGRHLDLYIKEKNPKAPDGVHDVEAIRKLRCNITRRQPRSLGRRDTSNSLGTPRTTYKRSPASEYAESSTIKSPLSQRGGGGESAERKHPFSTRDLEGGRPSEGDGAAEGSRAVPPQRVVSRQVMKQQLEARQRIQDALDTAKAAELALREMIGSWRAAKSVTTATAFFTPLLRCPLLTIKAGNK